MDYFQCWITKLEDKALFYIQHWIIYQDLHGCDGSGRSESFHLGSKPTHPLLNPGLYYILM